MRSLRLAALACLSLAATAPLVAGCAAADAAGTAADQAAETKTALIVQRPPQFVLLSFDGSYKLDMWQRTRERFHAAGAKLTYFVSGVYFFPGGDTGDQASYTRHRPYRALYRAPRHTPGDSAIGYGNDVDDVAARIAKVNEVLADGHEIAGHANGHFNGGEWSQSEWKSELDQFDAFLFGAYVARARTLPGTSAEELDRLEGAFATLTLRREDVRGFRAPFLANGPGLFRALGARGAAYDSSVTRAPNYWPTKSAATGVWDIPLAALTVPRGKGLPNEGSLVNSSDVGFHALQTLKRPGNAKLTNTGRYQEILETYRAYFAQSFHGNRAPLRIAHHFTQYWQDKARDDDGDGTVDHVAPYLEALEDFAAETCGKPEVRCVTFGELADYLAEHAAEIASFQAQQFEPYVPEGGVTPSAHAAPLEGQLASSRSALTQGGAEAFPAITAIPGADETCDEHDDAH